MGKHISREGDYPRLIASHRRTSLGLGAGPGLGGGGAGGLNGPWVGQTAVGTARPQIGQRNGSMLLEGITQTAEIPTFKDLALPWAARGFKTIPVARGKKRPVWKDWPDDASNTPEGVEQLQRRTEENDRFGTLDSARFQGTITIGGLEFG